LPGETVEVTIDSLGARGDGVARAPDGAALYVPFALPGERARVSLGDRDRAAPIEVSRPSPDRVAPVCPHFGSCGGCQLQHLDEVAIAAWKRERTRLAFAARGIDAPVAKTLTFPLARRRRAAFAAARAPRGVVIGFHAARGREIVPLAVCPVLAPEIEAALPGLARLAEAVLPRQGEIRLNMLQAENGLVLDIDGVDGVDGALAPEAYERLARAASAMGVLRLSLARNTVFSAGEPLVRFGPANVVPPPGLFLQAMAEAEAAAAGLVREAFAKSKRVADLFSGAGAFTFPLAGRSEMLAIDSDAAAIQALDRAARSTPGLKRVTAKVRDLFQAPLSPTELRDFDAVVFDPPRAGAKLQAEALARSKVPIVAAVSCDMATLARDARALLDGGFQLVSVTPIDQFRYSARIEAVAVFRRQVPRSNRAFP